MKIAAKTTLFILIAFIVSFSNQFEDFGLFNALSHANHNKTDSNSTLMKVNVTINTNNPENITSSNAGNETSNANKTEYENKQKHFLKKSQDKNRTGAKNIIKNGDEDNTKENTKDRGSDKTNDSNNINKPARFLSSLSSEKHENQNQSDSQLSNQTSDLSEEDQQILCQKLDLVLSNLTDFDIKVSQLRADFMNYTKTFLNHHFSLETPEKKEEFAKNKDTYLVSYSEKMNDLNQLLQKYKLQLYVIKNQEKCPNKVLTIMKEVQTNFINLVTLLKDEIYESKIPLSFIMINLDEKEESRSQLDKVDGKNKKFLIKQELKRSENVLL